MKQKRNVAFLTVCKLVPWGGQGLEYRLKNGLGVLCGYQGFGYKSQNGMREGILTLSSGLRAERITLKAHSHGLFMLPSAHAASCCWTWCSRGFGARWPQKSKKMQNSFSSATLMVEQKCGLCVAYRGAMAHF